MLDIHSLSNDQLLEQVAAYRRRIKEYESRAEQGETVDYPELRKAMSDLNHLKIQARLRGLSPES